MLEYEARLFATPYLDACFGGFSVTVPSRLSSGQSAAMSEAVYFAWGWRVPFPGSIVMLAIGLFIRFQIDETPEFKDLKRSGKTARATVIEALREPKSILLSIGAKIAESSLFNIYSVFAITYGDVHGLIGYTVAMGLVSAACTVALRSRMVH